MAGRPSGNSPPIGKSEILKKETFPAHKPSKTGIEVEAGIRAWQQIAFRWLLWAMLITGAVRLFMVFSYHPQIAPLKQRLLVLAMYGILVGVFLFKRLPHEFRVWLVLAAGFGAAATIFSSTGFQGVGRIFFLVMPMYALILVGRRSGWIASAISLSIYTLTAMTGSSLIPKTTNTISAVNFLFFQGIMLAFSLVTLLILMDSLIHFLRSTISAEREAAQERGRLEHLLFNAGERTRVNVGHQLHDGPCQQITAALLRCKVVENKLQAYPQGNEVIPHVQAITEILNESVGEIHDLAHGLSQEELEPDSFITALGNLATQASMSGTIECILHHEGDIRPGDKNAATQLFLLAQEAVNNALKHARPHHVTIEVRKDSDSLQLAISDDGTGMTDGRTMDGMGIRIMHHRAGLLGGSLSIHTVPDRGTTVLCSTPLPEKLSKPEETP